MTSVEYLDILDYKGNKTGRTAPATEIHEKGLIHRTVHVWILNSEGQLLLQKRAKWLKARAGYWDISAAGHISAGQTSIEAAKRELAEELNLTLSISSFEYLFTIESHSVLNNDTYINNEFQDVYLVRLDLKASEIKLTPNGEVDDVKFLSIDEFKKFVESNNELVVPHPEEYKKLIEYIITEKYQM